MNAVIQTLAARQPLAAHGPLPACLPADWLKRSAHFEAGQNLHDLHGAAVVRFIQSGWGLRCRLLKDGRRQILELLLPGDYLPLSSAYKHDSLSALTSCEIIGVPPGMVLDARSRSADADALIGGLEDRRGAILEERLVSLGRRDALESMAHLFCELLHRAASGDPTARCRLPATQVDLADIVGLSVVHTHRTLQALRSRGLAQVRRGWMRILDYEALSEIADFSPDYLRAD